MWISCTEHTPRFGHTVALHPSPERSSRRPKSCSLLVMQVLLCQPRVDFSMNRAHQLTDAEDSQAGRWGCFGNPKAPHLSLLCGWFPQGSSPSVTSHVCSFQGFRCSLPIPVHLTMLQELLEEVSWGTKGNGESQPAPRVTGGWRVARYCCFHPARLGAVQKWDMMCPKVTWQMSPKSRLDPTAFIPSPRHLRPPLHIAVGSHGPHGRRAGSFSL